MKMEVYQNKTVSQFLDQNEAQLLKCESENNLMLGLANRLLQNEKNSSQNSSSPLDELLLLTIMDERGEVVSQAMRTEGDKPLILSQMGASAVTSLISFLKEKKISLEGVIGPVEVAKTFAKTWGGEYSVGMHQGIYELTEVIQPDYEGGSMKLATEKDFKIVESFSLGFIRDCFPDEKDMEKSAFKAAQRNIESRSIYLWENSDGEVVSMAGNTRKSKNGATLSLVYTPSEHRNHGYGSKIVASLSQKLLDDGKKLCNLFTDLMNPTSNSIYQKVGYQKISESMHLKFEG